MALFSAFRSQVTDPLRENSALLMICVATGITMLGQGVIAPVLPLYAKDFGVSAAMVGASISVFGLARILFNLPSGMLSDRLGRRAFLVGGPVVIAIGTFLSGLTVLQVTVGFNTFSSAQNVTRNESPFRLSTSTSTSCRRNSPTSMRTQIWVLPLSTHPKFPHSARRG